MRFLVLPLALQAPRIWAALRPTPAPNLDRAFSSRMQEHHEQTQSSLRQIGDPQLKSWTQILIKDHRAEIQTEPSLLGGTDLRAADVDGFRWEGQTQPNTPWTDGQQRLSRHWEGSAGPRALPKPPGARAPESDRVEQWQIHLMGGR